MFKRTLIFSLLCLFVGRSFSQTLEKTDEDRQGISIWISTDTLAQEDYLELKFTIYNLEGNFNAPDLGDFEILRGPNVSQSISVINGVRSSTQSYSYLISPLTSSNVKIESIAYEFKGKILITDEIQIVVADKKEGRIAQRKSKKGITLFFSADQESAPLKKKKITQFKKRKV